MDQLPPNSYTVEGLKTALNNPDLKAYLEVELSRLAQVRLSISFRPQEKEEMILEDAFQRGQYHALSALLFLTE